MKLRNKLAAITAAAMLAFAGIGFASWTFNKDAEVDTTATISVLTEAENGTLTVDTASLYIILDQAGIYYASDAAGANAITTLDVTYTTTTDGTLGENMSVDFDLAWSGETTDWTYYVSGLDDVSLGTKTVVNGANAYSFTLPTLTYTAHKPSTESEYDTMEAALNGDTLTITVTANAAADDVAD